MNTLYKTRWCATPSGKNHRGEGVVIPEKDVLHGEIVEHARLQVELVDVEGEVADKDRAPQVAGERGRQALRLELLPRFLRVYVLWRLMSLTACPRVGGRRKCALIVGVGMGACVHAEWEAADQNRAAPSSG